MRSKTVLIVDEDSEALQNCSSILEQNGYQVLQARSTQQALEVWSYNSHAIELALVADGMTGMKGLEPLTQTSRKPIASSRGADSIQALLASGSANYHIFKRPFNLTLFLQITSNLAKSKVRASAA